MIYTDVGWVIAVPPGLSGEEEAEAIATGEHTVYRLETQTAPAPPTGCHVATAAGMATTASWRRHAVPIAMAAAFLAPLTASGSRVAAALHEILTPAVHLLA